MEVCELGVEVCILFPQQHTYCLSVWFICGSALLCLEGLVPPGVSCLRWLLIFLPPLLQGFLSPEGRGLMEMCYLGLSVLKSHSLHVWLWVCVFAFICCRRKLLCWLSKALICEYSRLSLGAILLLC